VAGGDGVTAEVGEGRGGCGVCVRVSVGICDHDTVVCVGGGFVLERGGWTVCFICKVVDF